MGSIPPCIPLGGGRPLLEIQALSNIPVHLIVVPDNEPYIPLVVSRHRRRPMGDEVRS